MRGILNGVLNPLYKKIRTVIEGLFFKDVDGNSFITSDNKIFKTKE